jgi:hypothetical protein
MEERAKDLAFAVLEFGISPSEYWNLTTYERDALVALYKRKNKKR